MVSLQSYIRHSRRLLRQWALIPRVHVLAEILTYTLAGLLLSAASLCNQCLPLTLGMLCSLESWPAVMLGLGGSIGYLLFWQAAGLQGILWLLPGFAAALLLGRHRLVREQPLLMPAITAFIVSAAGVIFQVWLSDDTSVPIYLLRILLASLSTYVFTLVRYRTSPIADWFAMGLAVLALAQVVPIPYFGLGFVAVGFLCVRSPFPAAALGGLALDLAQIVPVPMTAVVSLAQLARLIPRAPRYLPAAAVAGSYLLVMGICDQWDLLPIAGLLAGGIAGALWTSPGVPVHRRGETGAAQVRLELTAGVLSQAEQLLLEVPENPLDEGALIQKAADRACGSCPCRKNCRDCEAIRCLPTTLLHRVLLSPEELPVTCRKSGRVLLELRRSQEQLRMLRANRDRLQECRWAVIQQYQFLAVYLRELSDSLARKLPQQTPQFHPQISGYSLSREESDGDRFLWFAGTENRYYVLLCDGMGTGLGAAQDSRDAISMLQRLLSAGFPPAYALRGLNSLCVLRERPGAVTVDLLELMLESGRAVLYKWGAAPSYLLHADRAEKIGTAGPPPGLSVTESRETVERLSLRRGETLVLLSDGVSGEEILRRAGHVTDLPPGEAAAEILRFGCGDDADDATAVVIRLIPEASST